MPNMELGSSNGMLRSSMGGWDPQWRIGVLNGVLGSSMG